MNLLAIIIVLLAVITAGAIAYVAWELSSGKPVFKSRGPDNPADGQSTPDSGNSPDSEGQD